MTVLQMLDGKGRDVITVNDSASLSDTAKVLAENRIGAVLVMDAKGDICGIVSERDIIRALARDGVEAFSKRITTCATAEVISCSEKDTINDVMRKMNKGRFRHLPVIDDGELHGMISITDVVQKRMGEVEREAEEMKRYISNMVS